MKTEDVSASKTEQPEPPDEETQENVQDELLEAVKQKQESERKAAEYLDRLKRLQAEMENVQKITRRQVQEVTLQASERLLTKLLPSLDALQQAVNAASGNSLLPDETAVGLRMLQKQLTEILQSEGLEEIAAVGKQLDPELHEVVGYVESDEKPENIVVDEIRKGYTLNGKVIRPSLVVVSKIPKKTDPTQASGL
ncbi:MAG TPA: nucleotide exchange factor GrpE [Candidatus Acidoferrales bacterium]|nr:nucleotide exchange factor GrpE [Candidatus Acidoferrales bacterium]